MTWTSYAGMNRSYIDHDTHQIWTAVPTPDGQTAFAGRDGFEVWPVMRFEVHGDE